MRHFIFLVCIAMSFQALSQKIETYYDYNWKPCDLLNARFFSVLEKKDSGWHRLDYFVANKQLQMDAMYEDSACKIRNGKVVFFHPNGKLSELSHFIHNKKEGICVNFYSDGTMADSADYHNGIPIGVKLAWHRNGFIADSTAHVNDSMDIRVSWFDNGRPSLAGYYIKGKANGKWKFFNKSGNLSAEEIYNHGHLINKKDYDETGTLKSDTTSNDRPASFNGGKEAWNHYVEKKLYWPNGYRFVDGDMAVVVIQVVIGENGKVEHAEVVTPFHPEFDRIALKVIEQSPPWQPEILHNRAVKYSFRQSVAFRQIQ